MQSKILAPITSGAKILTGTKSVITGQARNLTNNIKRIQTSVVNQINKANYDDEDEIVSPTEVISVNRPLIQQKAQNIIKESMYESPYQMGQGASITRNVVNPYNPKRKSKSIVDQKDRFKSKNDIYPKVKVNNSIMDKRVRKVKTYLYKENGVPVATKTEHQPIQPFNPVS